VDVVIDCTMNQGSSGGPWLMSDANANATVAGVNSRCIGPSVDNVPCQPKSVQMLSEYFDDRVATFVQEVIAQL
jgi:hypothetical protein